MIINKNDKSGPPGSYAAASTHPSKCCPKIFQLKVKNVNNFGIIKLSNRFLPSKNNWRQRKIFKNFRNTRPKLA